MYPGRWSHVSQCRRRGPSGLISPVLILQRPGGLNSRLTDWLNGWLNGGLKLVQAGAVAHGCALPVGLSTCLLRSLGGCPGDCSGGGQSSVWSAWVDSSMDQAGIRLRNALE